MNARYVFVHFFMLLFLLLLSTAMAQAMNVDVRPDPEGTPTPVKIGIYVNDIAKIDNVNQTFTADFFVVAAWKDPRLAGSAKTRVLKLNEIWYPQFRIINRRDIDVLDEEYVTVDPEGNVLYRQRLYGDLGLHLDLREFPFDQHTLPIVIIAAGYGPDEIRFINNEEITGRSKQFSVADWVIGGEEIDVSNFYYKPADRSFSQFTYSLEAKRHADFYAWRIIAPLILIVFMSWMVFWIDPGHLEAQVGISATSVLTLVAFQFAVGHLLPHIAYLSRMDVFIVSTSVIVFLALVEGVTTNALTTHGKRELALRFDRWSRILFPLAFAVILVFAFII